MKLFSAAIVAASLVMTNGFVTPALTKMGRAAHNAHTSPSSIAASRATAPRGVGGGMGQGHPGQPNRNPQQQQEKPPFEENEIAFFTKVFEAYGWGDVQKRTFLQSYLKTKKTIETWATAKAPERTASDEVEAELMPFGRRPGRQQVRTGRSPFSAAQPRPPKGGGIESDIMYLLDYTVQNLINDNAWGNVFFFFHYKGIQDKPHTVCLPNTKSSKPICLRDIKHVMLEHDVTEIVIQHHDNRWAVSINEIAKGVANMDVWKAMFQDNLPGVIHDPVRMVETKLERILKNATTILKDGLPYDPEMVTVFAARDGVSKMMEKPDKSSAVLLTGESGSGKTVYATKKLLPDVPKLYIKLPDGPAPKFEMSEEDALCRELCLEVFQYVDTNDILTQPGIENIMKVVRKIKTDSFTGRNDWAKTVFFDQIREALSGPAEAWLEDNDVMLPKDLIVIIDDANRNMDAARALVDIHRDLKFELVQQRKMAKNCGFVFVGSALDHMKMPDDVDFLNTDPSKTTIMKTEQVRLDNIRYSGLLAQGLYSAALSQNARMASLGIHKIANSDMLRPVPESEGTPLKLDVVKVTRNSFAGSNDTYSGFGGGATSTLGNNFAAPTSYSRPNSNYEEDGYAMRLVKTFDSSLLMDYVVRRFARISGLGTIQADQPSRLLDESFHHFFHHSLHKMIEATKMDITTSPLLNNAYKGQDSTNSTIFKAGINTKDPIEASAAMKMLACRGISHFPTEGTVFNNIVACQMRRMLEIADDRTPAKEYVLSAPWALKCTNYTLKHSLNLATPEHKADLTNIAELMRNERRQHVNSIVIRQGVPLSEGPDLFVLVKDPEHNLYRLDIVQVKNYSDLRNKDVNEMVSRLGAVTSRGTVAGFDPENANNRFDTSVFRTGDIRKDIEETKELLEDLKSWGTSSKGRVRDIKKAHIARIATTHFRQQLSKLIGQSIVMGDRILVLNTDAATARDHAVSDTTGVTVWSKEVLEPTISCFNAGPDEVPEF